MIESAWLGDGSRTENVDRVLENCSAMTIVKVLQGEDLNL